jgi:hypothetical protein
MPYRKGPAKKKTGDPRGGWVGQSTKKDWGQIYFFDIYFYRVFELPSSRNAQKRVKNKLRKSRFWIFGNQWKKKLEKLFDTIFFAKRFL